MPAETEEPTIDELDGRAVGATEAETLFGPFAGQRIVLAVSGGPDSMAMMHLAAAAAPALRMTLVVATVDHGLRPDSAADAAFVRQHAEKLGFSCAVLHWQGGKPATRIQELAREARYRLLVDHAREVNAPVLITAHTLDDQAETILFRMARGSGLGGLVGMRACVRRNGVSHARPLLGVPKLRLIETCRTWAVPYRADASNANVDYARVRWRALMPMLAEEGLTAERLQRLSNRLARADAALAARADTVILAARREIAAHPGKSGYDAAIIAAEPIEIVIRIVGFLIERMRDTAADVDGTASFQHVPLSRLEALAEAFQAAMLGGRPLRRTLAGLVFDHAGGVFSIDTAPPRRSRKPLLL
ncbi:MAG: tRNA lysidine(34) synthetase TilS [Beijerinckiaceae bacterium]|nr:tRNA lysidine(34) synthetase TilS [Beijerinckiaceae bacterium]